LTINYAVKKFAILPVKLILD